MWTNHFDFIGCFVFIPFVVVNVFLFYLFVTGIFVVKSSISINYSPRSTFSLHLSQCVLLNPSKLIYISPSLLVSSESLTLLISHPVTLAFSLVMPFAH